MEGCSPAMPCFSADEEVGKAAAPGIGARAPNTNNPIIEEMLAVLKDLMHTQSACYSFTHQRWQAGRTRPAFGTSSTSPGLSLSLSMLEQPQLHVIEDMRLDARTAGSPLVLHPPHLRFCAAVPLVSRNSQRCGTLCVLDTRPQSFGSARAAMLSNFAETLMWVLEGPAVTQVPRVLAGGDAEEEHTLRSASMPAFQLPRLRLKVESGCSDSAVDRSRSATRSCSLGGLDSVENPARSSCGDDLDQLASSMKRLYSMRLGPRQGSYGGRGAQPRPPLRDLRRMGSLIGAGDYAKVYRGEYMGETVAVKVVKEPGTALCEGGVPLEASLMLGLQHPNIVGLKTYKMAQTAAGSTHLWLVLEFCDQGTFADGLDQGLFGTAAAANPCPSTLLHMSQDIAAGLAFLHSRSILHCDLSGGNVLFHTCATSPHGFTARIADFGACRRMGTYYPSAPPTGTFSYMAPEVMAGGCCTQASDVFSLGVLIHEMLAARRAWEGLNQFQISYAVLNEGQSLTLDSACALGSLALRCMDRDPSLRPTAARLTDELGNLLKDSPILDRHPLGQTVH